MTTLIEKLKSLRGSPDAIIVPRRDFDEIIEVLESIEELKDALLQMD